MTLLNIWILFGIIPLYYLYKKHTTATKQIKLLYLSLLFMFLAIARPVYENAYVKKNFNSHDYIIALDVSFSMQANDIKPTRYTLAKEAIKRLIRSDPKDRFTLFAFTSSTLLISPPTTDYKISIMALDALNPKYILTKGTNLKNLFTTVAKLPMKQKKLIIFSDGGDEHDLQTVALIAKKNSITPYIVATATTKGAALKKDGKYIKNTNNSIVISKINPMLKDLASINRGKYYHLNTLDDITTLSNDLQTEQTKKETIEVKTYKELFFIPLLFSILFFFFAVTKFGQKFFLLLPLLLLSPLPSKAGSLDFYYLIEASHAYSTKHFKKSATIFTKIAPSPKSYYNIATAYYKAGAYKKAMKYYTQIRTQDKNLKYKIYYNLGNTAVKLKRYDKAKRYYIYALALHEDTDALYNLNLLKKLHLKTKKDRDKIVPQSQTNSQKKKLQRDENKREKAQNNKSKNSSKNSSSSGGTTLNNKKPKEKIQKQKAAKKRKTNYRFTYKAYEKINKGYTDEKEPW